MHAIDLLLTREYALAAVAIGTAIGLVCSLLSVMVVLKRMAFIGQGISHAGFGGVGTAVLLGYSGAAFRFEHDLIVFAFCLVTALFLGVMTRRRRIEADTAIGIVLSATMAWGIIASNLRTAWRSDWPAYAEFIAGSDAPRQWDSVLFGSIFNASLGDAAAAWVMALLVLAVCFAFYKEIVFYTFDETVSRVFGVRSAFIHYLLLILLSVVIVFSIRWVGLILVSALLIMPGAAALLLTRRMSLALAFAGAIGVGGSALGVLFALQVGTIAGGPCIVAVLAALFALAYLASRFGGSSARPAPSA